MTPTYKRRWPLVVSVVVLVIASYILIQSRPIPRPQGDGEFKELSGWLGPIRDRGYNLRFEEFDLSLPFTAEYHVSGLTNVGDRCWVKLILIDVKGAWPAGCDHDHVGGRLALRLSTSAGEEVFDTNGPLGTYIWSAYKNKRGLYHKDMEMNFAPDAKADYVFEVVYEPAPELAGMRAYVSFDSGARYSGSWYR